MGEWSQLSVTKLSTACNGAGSVLGAHLPLPLYFSVNCVVTKGRHLAEYKYR